MGEQEEEKTMKFDSKYIIYAFPVLLLALSGVFHSVGFAYAACLALALGFTKDEFDKYLEIRSTKSTDSVLKHKLEALEASVSAMVARERARGF